MADASAHAARSAGLLPARRALGWLVLGEWRAHPGRIALAALAIAVGVALGFAVHLVNKSALASFDHALGTVNGAADLRVNATSPLGLDERIYPRVATAAGVADASPAVVLQAAAGAGSFTLLGLDVIRAAQVTPSLVGTRPPGVSGSDDIFAADAVFLSAAALRATGARPGGTVAIRARGRVARFRVAGTLPAVSGTSAIGVIDIAAAQWRFGRLGRIDRIDLKLAHGDTARAALRRLLPPDAALATASADAAQGDALSRAYRVNLDMLALVALLTGGFLVYSAQSLSVARRLRSFALVRTLGLSRRALIGAVALEGLAIGLVGALGGLVLGSALAWGALRLFGGDLGAGYFGTGGARLVFAPAAAAVFFVLGLAVAIGGSAIPARAAGRAAPAAALRNAGDPIDPRAPVPWRAALLLLGAGVLAALLPAFGGLPIFGYLSMALLLAGGVAGVPFLARHLLDPLVARETLPVPATLALRHLHGAPGQAVTALAGIVASTALMIAMAVMVTSFRGAVDQWLGQVLSADLYLRLEGGAVLDPAAQARLARVPGVARIEFQRQVPLTLAPDRPPVVLIARTVDARQPDRSLVLLSRATALPAGTVPVWVSEPASRIYGWKAGGTITLPIGRPARLGVAGVWRDYARQSGAVVIATADYTRLTGDPARDEAAVTLAPGADGTRVGRALVAALPAAAAPAASVAAPRQLRAFALDLFDRSFAVTYLLEAIAIVVGLAGVAATMSAQVIARIREFGMLRHLGLSRRQLTLMLGTEGALLGAVGGTAGILLGLAMAQVLIQVVNPQSFGWTMGTRLPLGTFAGVATALVVAAAGTAMLAGRRATAVDAVRAVREDW